MASNIEIEFESDPRAYGAIKRELAALDDDDVSASSPVSAGAPEAGVDAAGGVLRVEGHEGDFTKTSQEALLTALRKAGVEEPEVTGGGYEPDE